MWKVALALVTFHHAPKLTSADWCFGVRLGKLAEAIRSFSAVRHAGPWTVLCNNEAFCTAASKRAMTAAGVHAWRVPASPPDLNPVEKMCYGAEFAPRIARISERGALQSAR